jgi:hypothetical protein
VKKQRSLNRMSEGKLNGLVLGVQNSEAYCGNQVATWHYDGGANQLFYEDYLNGCIRSALGDNLYLEISGRTLG